jgi:hypothetical protein
MITSNRLTAERWEEIKQFPITYTEDCPRLSREQLMRMKPKHPENFLIKPLKAKSSINFSFAASEDL